MERPGSPDGGQLAPRCGSGAGLSALLGGFLEQACHIRGGILGVARRCNGGLVNSGLAPMRDQRRPAWARWGGVLGSVAIAFEPPSGSLGAIMVGLGALVGHPRRASEDAPGPFCAKEQTGRSHMNKITNHIDSVSNNIQERLQNSTTRVM